MTDSGISYIPSHKNWKTVTQRIWVALNSVAALWLGKAVLGLQRISWKSSSRIRPPQAPTSRDREGEENVRAVKNHEKPQPGWERGNEVPGASGEERAQARGACAALLSARLVTSGCTSKSLASLTKNCNGKSPRGRGHHCPVSNTGLLRRFPSNPASGNGR